MQLESLNIPNDYESEKMLISQLLLSNDVVYDIIDVGLTYDDFFNPELSGLYKLIIAMVGAGKVANMITLGLDIENELVTYALSTSGSVDYANIIKEKSMKRKLIKQSEKIKILAIEKESNIEILKEETDKIMNICFTQEEIKPYNAELDEIHQELYETPKDKVKTNYKIIDEKISFKAKQLVTIAGRPGTGKSAIMGSFALSMEKVALFSLEMSRQEVSYRFISNITGIPFNIIDGGMINQSKEIRDKVKEGFDKIKAKNMSVFDNKMKFGDIKLEIKKLKITKGIKAVFIDYLQLIGGTDSRLSRAIQIGTMTRALKTLAKELDIFIMIGSQLNREIEKRPNKTPQLSDLRESGDIEQDSDIVLFIDDDETEPDCKELIVGKYRNGKKNQFKMKFKDETMTLIDKYYIENKEEHKKDNDDDDSIF